MMNNMFQNFMNFMQNPTQFIIKSNLNIPKQYLNNPNDAIQYLLNSGRISQDQYNKAVQQANSLKRSPEFCKMFNNKR